MKKCTKCDSEKEESCFYHRSAECKECRKQRTSEYYYKNREIVLEKQSIYGKKQYELNPKKFETRNNKWKSENKEKVKALAKKHRENPENKKRRNENRTLRFETDINYLLLERSRKRMWDALKGIGKQERTIELLGCDTETLKNHLQSNFKVDMNWSNYGPKGWHIDHIIPCSSFDLTNKEQRLKCFHYTNLQPLWWYENLAKKDKLDEQI